MRVGTSGRHNNVHDSGKLSVLRPARGLLRIAVVSDIYGNLEALKAVLEDIKAREVDVTVNSGDVVSGPLFPAECADLLILSVPKCHPARTPLKSARFKTRKLRPPRQAIRM